MNLRGQILFIILMPICLMVGFSSYFHFDSWQHLDHDLQVRATDQAKKVADDMHRIQKVSATLAGVLSSNLHIRKSMEKSDLEGLYSISSGFLGLDDIRILFIDLDNRVLLRNYDEYRFGDILGFDPEKNGPQMIVVDGILSFGTLVPIKLNGIDLVGYVLTAYPLDTKGLNKFAPDEKNMIRIAHKQWTSQSKGPKDLAGWSLATSSVKLGSETLHLSVYQNNIAEKEYLQRSIIISLSVVVVLSLILAAAISHFLGLKVNRPLESLLTEINSYSAGNNPNFIKNLPNNELGKVGTALDMLHKDLEEKKVQKHRLVTELMREKEKLKNDNTLLQVLCHDLSNPLAVLKGAVMVLHKRNLIDASQKKIFSKLERSIETAEAIVTNVKDMMAVQSGKKEMVIEEVSIEEVVESARFIFEAELQKKDLTLNYQWQSPENAVFYAEKVAFSNQVFNNIISNAIKFSPRGEQILVTARLEEDYMVLEITDSGDGVPPDILPNLFSSDVKTSMKGTEGESGTGFGLPVVKSYMSYFDGEVTVRSRFKEEFPESSGTSFILRLKAKKLLQVV